jgi:Flp pilus assembly pilin Flp
MTEFYVRFIAMAMTQGRARDDRGQATAEYALVLLGAAAVALLLVAWATRTNRIGRLVDFVLDQIIGRVT